MCERDAASDSAVAWRAGIDARRVQRRLGALGIRSQHDQRSCGRILLEARIGAAELWFSASDIDM